MGCLLKDEEDEEEGAYTRDWQPWVCRKLKQFFTVSGVGNDGEGTVLQIDDLSEQCFPT